MKNIFTIAIVAISINAFAQKLEKFAEGYKYGFRDKSTKKVIIPAKYTSVIEFVDGIAAVTESPLGSPNMVFETKWKVININGKEIINEEFDRADIKKNGIAFVFKLNKTEMNPSGYSNGRPIYKVGVIKKDGTYLFPCEYDGISEIGIVSSQIKEYYRIFSKEKGVGIINYKGFTVIEPQQKFDIQGYVGCDLFLYQNKDSNRNYYTDTPGGLIDSKQNVLLNQDSIDFIPSTIINSGDCSNKKNLFGVTGGKSSAIGIYRVGYGIIVPKSNNYGGLRYFEIKPNVIEIYERDGKKLVEKYDWNGKLIFSTVK